MTCPLCLSEKVRCVESLRREWLVRSWREKFHVDVGSCFSQDECVKLFCCTHCDLLFYSPAPLPSAGFYEALSSHPWYYQDDKWEHRVVWPRVYAGERVLDIGSGAGAFLRGVKQRGGIAVGIETNPLAAQACRSAGIDVFEESVEKVASREQEGYDMVCAFQVLEHVPEPLTLLKPAIQLLRPGGRLVCSVPNNASFVGRSRGVILNMPPHHATRWNPTTFRALSRVLPLGLETLMYEPLQACHHGWYCKHATSPLLRVRGAWRVRGHATRVLAGALRLGVSRFIRGHTLLGIFLRR
jgi:2-polyprenyl-3-methyl-5-hydroxy-6-metoxy-1,4-benzoquinol methylase